MDVLRKLANAAAVVPIALSTATVGGIATPYREVRHALEELVAKAAPDGVRVYGGLCCPPSRTRWQSYTLDRMLRWKR